MNKSTLVLALSGIVQLASYGQWTGSDMPDFRMQMNSATIGSKAYFAGGWTGFAEAASVFVYDGADGQWTTLTMSVPRVFPDAVSSGSKLFVAGGSNAGQTTSVVDIYDAATQQWTVSQLSQARFGIGVASSDEKVLFAGGVQLPLPSSVVYDVVDIYDIGLGSWSTANLSQARGFAHDAVVADNKAFFAGGQLGDGTQSDRVDIYDLGTGVWSTATLSQARNFIGAGTVGDKVLFAGGVKTDGTLTDRVDIYDLTTGTWSIDSISVARGFTDNVATVCDKVYFVGGVGLDPVTQQFNEDFSEIDVYDGSTWSVDQLPYDLWLHSVTAVGNELVVAGGATGFDNDFQLRNTARIFTACNVGINERGTGGSFTIFPNPANDQITVVLNDWQRGNYSLIDAAGRMVQQGRLVSERTVLPTARMDRGIYMLRVEHDGVIANQRVVLQ